MKKKLLAAAMALLMVLSEGICAYAEDMAAGSDTLTAAKVVSEEVAAQTATKSVSLLDGISRVVIAVNTNLDAEEDSSASFTASRVTSDEVYGGKSFTDPVTGETYYAIDYSPRMVREKPSETDILLRQSQQAATGSSAAYKVGDTKTIYSEYSDYPYDEFSISMECLYVGEHCTVWGQQADNWYYRANSGLILDEEQAEEIGTEFEKNFSAITGAFGSYWYDVDKDGKLAIYCYDIDRDYKEGTGSGGYVAGYFYCYDMADSNNKINGVEELDGCYDIYPTGNYVDCIHIDTYPGMGGSHSKLQYIDQCYSTLMHEFQHMINFSYTVKNGSSGYFYGMETYLDEAFAMAAEHMICGASETESRIEHFNSTYYTPGDPLTYWDNEDEDRNYDNYSNSYLFGQYLRTRWAQYTGSETGNDFFKAVFSRRNKSNAGDTLQIIADMLSTTKTQLVVDFWTAVWVKDDTGPYGFNGEAWANKIDPQVDTDSGYIYNGGAKYFSYSEDQQPSGKGLAFVTITGGGAVLQGTTLSMGDVNGNGEVEITDMACLYQYLSEAEPTGNLAADEELFDSVADFNGDGTINILDYQALYQEIK